MPPDKLIESLEKYASHGARHGESGNYSECIKIG